MEETVETALAAMWEEVAAGVPRLWPTPEWDVGEVKAGFIAGAPYRGRPTRLFAYWGVPARPDGGKVPGIVLVHGGGGSAFHRWVRLWNERGYAAISVDTCGNVSGNVHGDEQTGHVRHEWAGPEGWHACFGQIDEPVEDQWPFHAMAATLAANTFLGSLPGVDAARIGLTGISWGAVVACLAAGADPRFCFCAPVYGCGFLVEDADAFAPQFKLEAVMSPAQKGKWERLWDPRHYLPLAKMPFLWVGGTNDFAFSMRAVQRSADALPSPAWRCTRVRMVHGHGAAGETPGEIRAFADWAVGRGPRPPRCIGQSLRGDRAVARFDTGGMAIVRASLCHTLDDGGLTGRLWRETPMEVADGRTEAPLPSGTTAWFANVVTDGGLVASSDLFLGGDT